VGLSWRALGLDHNFKLIEVRTTSEKVYGKSIYGGNTSISCLTNDAKVADEHFFGSVQLSIVSIWSL